MLSCKDVVVYDYIHQGEVPLLSIHEHIDPGGLKRTRIQRDPFAGNEPGGHSGDRALHHERKDVVRSSRDRKDRNRAVSLGHGPIRPVSPQDDDTRCPLLLHVSSRLRGILLLPGGREINRKDVGADLELTVCPVHDPVVVRHVADAVHAHLGQPEQDPSYDPDLLLIVEHAPVGHQPADVLARRRVRNDAYKRHVSSLISSSTLSLKRLSKNA
jgi:hypothetical protein